jgi:hypothetical protein
MAVYETSLSNTQSGVVYANGHARQVVVAAAIVACTTAMIDNAADDVGLFNLPAGAVVVGITAGATDMDGATAMTVDVGDSADEDRLLAASTIGQAGTLTTALARTGFLYKYTAKTQIRAYIATASGTPAAGTLYVAVAYFVDPDFSTTALVAA